LVVTSHERHRKPKAGRDISISGWATRDEKDDDFIAVVDVLEGSPTYDKVLTSQPVGLKGSMPHHFEYELPAAGQLLFGNAHNLEKLIMVDFSEPLHPRVAKIVDPVPPYHYPATFRVSPVATCLSVIFAVMVPALLQATTTIPAITAAKNKKMEWLKLKFKSIQI